MAFLNNTNIDIERNTRNLKRENMKSQHNSPVKKVHYPDQEENTRTYYQDTDHYRRRRSPRQCEYYDEYDRSMNYRSRSYSRDRDEYYRYQSPSPSYMYGDYRGAGHRSRREERMERGREVAEEYNERARDDEEEYNERGIDDEEEYNA